MLRRYILLATLSLSTICPAQQPACGLTTMTETATPFYPPIAKAAHIDGPVVMLATFATSGEVEAVQLVTGHKLLQAAAVTFVQSWRANPYTGPRTCPVVVTFAKPQLAGLNNPQPMVRLDPQHVVLNSTYIVIAQTKVRPTS